jgi:hypothetical protein
MNTFAIRQIHGGFVTSSVWRIKSHLDEEGRVLELQYIKNSSQEGKPNGFAKNLATSGLRRKCKEDIIWRC